MPTYTFMFHAFNRYQLTDSMGGVGSVYINYSSLGYRVGISTVWSTSNTDWDCDLLYLHLDESLVPGRMKWNTDQHDVFTSQKEALAAFRKFMTAGCPGLTLTNLAAAKANKKANNSAAKARKATNILRGMELADLLALRKEVDAAIAKKSPKK